jgi:VanZ family protein
LTAVWRGLATWLPASLWAGLIFVLSSIPGTRLPVVGLPLADKLAHTLVYAVLGALILRALAPARSAPRIHPLTVVFAVALATVYGISDEVHQLWTPNRSCDWHDAVADAVGASAGTLGVVAMRWMKFRRCLMMGRSKN